MPAQRKGESSPTLHMNPEDASARGLVSGGAIRVNSERGALGATLLVSEDVRAGTVALPGKWWDLASANLLTAGRWSPAGQPAYNDTFVEVANDGREVDRLPDETPALKGWTTA